MTAEADMWAAAVEQAFRAGCASRIPGIKLDMGGATALEAANEWRFLTASHGPWAESRKRICEMCGIEPEVVRQEALRRGPSRHALFGLRGEMKHAEMLRNLNARDQRMMKDYASGRDIAEMVKEYGVSDRRIKQIAGEHRVKRQRQHWLPKKDIKARNAAMLREYAAGVSIHVLTSNYGLTASTIQTIAGKNGVKRPEGYNAAIGLASAVAAMENGANAARNAEIFDRWKNGASYGDIGRALDMNPQAVRSVIARMRKRTASNASGEVLGGACVAGGGGGGVEMSSFHAGNHSQGAQT